MDMKERAAKAAQMAGAWWAARLDERFSDKREAFAAAVAKRVKEALDGDAYWSLGTGRVAGNGKPERFVHTESDYDPRGLLLDAVREVLEPECRGFGFSSRGILPEKHELSITREVLKPKEGYGRWTAEIVVPE